MTFPPMRSQLELQRVHDLLGAVLSSPLRLALRPGIIGPVMMATDCLCWCLHHDDEAHPDGHASHFAEVVQTLEETLLDLGISVGSPAGEYVIEAD